MRKTIVFILVALVQNTIAQNANVIKYIDTYKELAISEMKRTGIPASITIAQGILETESGKSDLVLKSNNHFGIKCKSTWTGETVYHNDDEKGECFRKYTTAEESYRDHSNFLRNSERYASLFLLDADDYKGWAHGLKKAGYATNPRYPYILINSIEKYNLHQYTLMGKTNESVFDKGQVQIAGAVDEQTITMNPQVSEVAAVNGVLKKAAYRSVDAVYAPAGTSLLAIATQFKIPLRRLLEYNDLTREGLLSKSQWLFLDKKLKEGEVDQVASKPGQSLHDVAQENAVQMESLLKYNDLKEDGLLPARTMIALKPGVALQQVEEIAAMSKKIHQVLPKEGLYAISKKYKVSVNDIKEWNNLSNDQLRVGQQLIILK